MAQETVTAPYAHPDSFFIGGEWAKPSSRSMIDVINSGTEELYVRVAEAQEADIERAVAAARRAFDEGPWPQLSHAERAKYLRAIGAEIRLRAPDLARNWIVESGAVRTHADMSTGGLGNVYDYYAGVAESFPWYEPHKSARGGVGLLAREAVGVVAAIIPWNSPATLIAYKVAPALLAGCCIIVKTSPEAPGAAYILAEICAKIGLPPGVVNILTADRAVSEMLVRHPGVDKVTFTGSTAAGRKIGAICGERIARCTLELGGKSAAVILDDADIEAAARNLAASGPMLAGQICAALTRIVVTKSRHDEMVEALCATYGQTRVGDPFDTNTQMGPLAMARQRDRVEGYIAKGKAEGAQLACGGGRPAHLNRGYFIEPTIFGHVDNASTIAREEIFGPVLSVIAADDEADAIRIANDTEFGLNATVFTPDIERFWSAAKKIRSGTVGHNGLRADFGIAFGGYKQSGIGREGGVEGLRPYLELKTLVMDEMPAGLVAE